MLILLALQSNSVGSVLSKNGRLGAGNRELKPVVATPPRTKSYYLIVFSHFLFSKAIFSSHYLAQFSVKKHKK